MGTIFKLIIEDDEGKTTVYPLSHGEVSIGRKDGNTIRLMERNVSRRHARLMRSNGSVFIEDLDSYNGIRINGERINGKYEVKEGDLVEIGDYHLALQAAEVEEEHRAEVSRPDSAGSGESMAGTVPDFRLPDEILAGVRAGPKPASGSARDTIVDQPLNSVAPQPAVLTKSVDKLSSSGSLGASLNGGREPLAPRGGDDRALPPFPLAGGLTPATGTPGRKPPTDSELRTREMKPVAPKKEGEVSSSQPVGTPAPARTAPTPRLVCVSTSYAGREFPLSRPELVIGRVEDNDIVIEHRSVSRNHAKIVFDGRVHKIIDLQSANGILVNGEEYAMTDLRKGDLIELGHVRFRFVPGNEAFVPSDDEMREMREAGVSMSSASDSPARTLEMGIPGKDNPSQPPRPAKREESPDVQPAFDPSTAATVTDTPISALSMDGVRAPEIQTPTPTMTPPIGLEKRPDGTPRRPEASMERSVRTEVGAARNVSQHDQRPTEINVSTSRPNGATHTPAAPVKPVLAATPAPAMNPRTVAEDAADDSDPPKKVGLYVGAAVGVLVIVGLVVALLGSGQNEFDKQLEQHFQAREFETAAKYCEQHNSAFGDQVASLKLCLKVQSELSKVKPPEVAPAPAPTPTPEAAPGPEGALEKTPPPTEAADPPPGDPSEEAVVTDATPSEVDGTGGRVAGARTRRPSSQDKARENRQRAKDHLDKGMGLVTGANGVVTNPRSAIDEFESCLRLQRDRAECHAGLGLAYGLLDEPQKAVDSFEQAMRLKPEPGYVQSLQRPLEKQLGKQLEKQKAKPKPE